MKALMRVLRSSLVIAAALLATSVSLGRSSTAAGERTYHFSTSGNDRNDGLSADRPKASLALVPDLLRSGGAVRLRRGDVWNAPGLVWDLSNLRGTAEAPLRVADYGDPALPRPVIASAPRIIVKGTRHLTLARLDLRGGKRWPGVRVESGSHDVVLDDVAFGSVLAAAAAPPVRGMTAPTYYFSMDGNDAFSGLSCDSAKKSLNLVQDLLQPGVTILFKRGDAWYDPALNWALEQKNGTAAMPMRLGAYGSTNLPRPIIANMSKSLPSEWTCEGNDVFSIPQYLNSTLDRTIRVYLVDPVTGIGTPIPRGTSCAALTDRAYCVDNGRIYIKCAGFTNPALVHSVESIQWPYTTSIFGMDVQYLTIEDIEFRGGTGTAQLTFYAPTDHITLRNLTLRENWSYGVGLSIHPSNPGVGLKNSNVEILDTRIDRSWAPEMDYEPPHEIWNWNGEESIVTGANGGQSGGDGVIFADAVDGAVVRGCFITNYGHSGIQTQYRNLAHFGIKNVVIEQDTLTAGSSGYFRPLAIGGNGSMVSDITIRRCYTYSSSVNNQLGGERMYVYSNVFDRVTDSPLEEDSQSRHLVGAIGEVTLPDSTVDTREMKHCVIANNVFYDAECMALFSPATGPVGPFLEGNVIANNLFVNWQHNATSEFGHAIIAQDAFRPELDFLNNGFWSASGYQTVYFTYSPNVSYDVAELNALTNCDGNELAEPQFAGGSGLNASKFAQTGTSPYVAGGTSLANLLPAGIPPVDFYGYLYAYSASRGAIQVPGTAITSVAINGAPESPFFIGGTFNFSADITPANGTVAIYAWEIKRNGVPIATGTGPAITYQPTDIGSYEISLTVTDQPGTVHVASPVTVSVVAVPIIYATLVGSGPPPEVLEEGAAVPENVEVHIQYAESVVATRNSVPFSMPLTGEIVTLEGAYEVTAHGYQVRSVTFTIDRTPPVISGVVNGAHYNTNRTITFNEGTATLNGVPIANGHIVTNNGGYTVVVTDAVQLTTSVSFTIDKVAPVVNGVSNGQLYSSSVTITFNEGTATLDGAPFTSGGVVSAEGPHTLVVTDQATNSTTVSFTIYLSPPTITALDGYGNVLAEGGITDTTVAISLDRFVSATLTYNGSTSPLAGNTIVTADGSYRVTAVGISTVERNFTIRRIPTLSLPPDGATGVSRQPTFTWTAPPNASSYRLQVSTSSTFSSLAINQAPISGPTYAVPPPKLAKTQLYYWRVNATGPAGTTAWSAVRSFTTGNN